MNTAGETASKRIHYLDNLRALAMLLGVYLHAGLAYADPAQSVWLATDTRSSVWIDASIWFIHLFRMGLFFSLSGYFAKLVIERKGVRHFVWSRTIRLGLPFILFYPCLLVAMTGAMFFSLSYLESPKGLMGVIAEAVKDTSDNKQTPTPGTMHLWFLYYLIFFTLMTALFSRWKWTRFALFLEWLTSKRVFIAILPMVLVPAVIAAGVPMPAPESFIPVWWSFLFYGTYYLAGWHFFGREASLAQLLPFTWHILWICAALFLVYYWTMPVLNLQLILEKKIVVNTSYVVAAILTAYLSVALSVASILLGRTYLQNRNGFLSFMADASYWVYLVHLPIVMLLQTILVPWEWPVGIKFAAVLMGTMLSSMAMYCVFVRYTPIGWMLHGKRSFP